MEKKFITAEKSEINEVEQSIIGWGSKPVKDRDDELIESSAWKLDAFRKNPVIMLCHDYSAPPVGKALWVKADSNGLKFKAKFANTERGREVYQLFKEGIMSAFSVGFKPNSGGIIDNPTDGKYKGMGLKRVFTDVDLLEISCVPIPSNSEALVEAVKSGKIKTKQLKDELEAVIELEIIKCQECEAKQDEEEKAKKEECPKCGTEIPEDADKCPKCGAKLEEKEGEKNEEKEATEPEVGEGQPAEADGQKATEEGEKEVENIEEKGGAGSNNLADSEPSWGSVDKTALPRAAFADQGDPEKKSTWRYPHHFVSDGTMYLHRGGLRAALAAAGGARSGQTESDSAVVAHLKAHAKAIGMGEDSKDEKNYTLVTLVVPTVFEIMKELENITGCKVIDIIPTEYPNGSVIYTTGDEVQEDFYLSSYTVTSTEDGFGISVSDKADGLPLEKSFIHAKYGMGDVDTEVIEKAGRSISAATKEVIKTGLDHLLKAQEIFGALYGQEETEEKDETTEVKQDEPESKDFDFELDDESDGIEIISSKQDETTEISDSYIIELVKSAITPEKLESALDLKGEIAGMISEAIRKAQGKVE